MGFQSRLQYNKINLGGDISQYPIGRYFSSIERSSTSDVSGKWIVENYNWTNSWACISKVVSGTAIQVVWYEWKSAICS